MKKMTSISAILMGDTLAKVVEQLHTDNDDKLLVILIDGNNIRLANTPGISRVEALGAIQIAYELIMTGVPPDE